MTQFLTRTETLVAFAFALLAHAGVMAVMAGTLA